MCAPMREGASPRARMTSVLARSRVASSARHESLRIADARASTRTSPRTSFDVFDCISFVYGYMLIVVSSLEAKPDLKIYVNVSRSTVRRIRT